MSQEQSQVVAEAIMDEVRADEKAPQLSSWEIPHADRVITVHGITGAIGSLVNVCPVEDRSAWTQESVNIFVDKLISMDESRKNQEEESEEKETEEIETTEAKKKLN